MARRASMRGEKEQAPTGYRIIGALKLANGLLLFAAWLGMFHLLKGDAAEGVGRAALQLHLDPENRVLRPLLSWASGLDRRHLRSIEAGTLGYVLLHVVEGAGLVLGRRWAGYLTIVATGSLVPYECYEIARHVRPIRIVVLI